MNNQRKNKELALEFFTKISGKNKAELFEHINDDQFEEIKKAFAAETRIRNEKRYYRFENQLTDEIEWCVESKLGTHLKSDSFKAFLKVLGKTNKLGPRNSRPEVYSLPAKQPYKSAEELEAIYESDKANGLPSKPRTLTPRPTKIRKLQC